MPTLRPPSWLIAAGFAGWAGCIGIATWASGDEPNQLLINKVATTLATVFANIVVGGGILAVWQRQQWRRRTQWVLGTLLRSAMARVEGVAHRILVGPLAPFKIASEVVDHPFRLPWREPQRAAMARISAEMNDNTYVEYTAFPIVDTAWEEAVTALVNDAEKLFTSCRDVIDYLDGTTATSLLASAGKVQYMVRALTEYDIIEVDAALLQAGDDYELGMAIHNERGARLRVGLVLEACIELATRINVAYDDLYARATGEVRNWMMVDDLVSR